MVFVLAQNDGHASVGRFMAVAVVAMVMMMPLGVRTIVFGGLRMVMVAAGGEEQEGASAKKEKKKDRVFFHRV